MYYIYLPYVLILAILTAILCRKQQKSLAWVGAVFLAPIITPYFIIKSERPQAAKWIVWFIISFILMITAEGFLWYRAYKENSFDRLNPIERTTVRLTQAIEENTAKLNKVMQTLDIKNNVASGKKEILIARDLISQANVLMKRGEMLTKKFVLFTTNYGPYFQKRKQLWAIELRNFYKSKSMAKYYATTHEYLNNFEQLLNYSQKHFDQIRSKKAKAMKSYDQYFIRYRRGLNHYQLYSDRRMKVQKALVKKYPRLKPYLPEKSQTRAVKLWE